MTVAAPSSPTYAMTVPRSVRPQPEPGALPGPHSMYQPVASSSSGSSHRRLPNHGPTVRWNQVVTEPSPGRKAMSVTAARTSREMPTSERATSFPTSGSRIDVRPGRVRFLLAWRRLRVATLDLHDDREHHRPALGLLEQEAGHRVLDLALQQRDLADVLARVLDGLHDPSCCLVDDRVLLVAVDEAAGDDL